MVNEHRPYLPMMFFSSLLLHLFVERIQSIGRQAHLATKFVSLSGLIFIVAALFGATTARNKVFLTEESYTRDLVEKSPSARSYVNYGLVFLKRSDFGGARNWFELARNMAPNWFIPHVNLGIVEDRTGNADQAMAYYDRAVDLEAHTAISLKYRSMAMEQRGNTDAAIADLRLALSRASDDCEIISRLVGLLKSRGEDDPELATHMKRCI
jgi:tetratricopeptide (TPR) repeat protein